MESFIKPTIPGGAVLVVQDGQTLYEAGYGVADIETGKPITPQTIFHLGSVGKQFTALAILMLLEDGKLKLDEPVGNYVPELARFGPEVTIRRMLNHTSGLPDYYSDDDLSERLFALADMPTNEDAVKVLEEAGNLQFTSGDQYEYNNSAYDMLGLVVQRLSGKSLASFLAERVFDPLGMTSTFSLPSERREMDANVAHSYVREDGEIEAYDFDPLDNLVGSGSVYSTVRDMALYDEALYGEQLVKQVTLAEAFAPTTLNDGSEYEYGFGWDIGTVKGEPYVGHSGSWLGFISYYVRFPERRLGVVALLNRDYDLPDEAVAIEIAKFYLKQNP